MSKIYIFYFPLLISVSIDFVSICRLISVLMILVKKNQNPQNFFILSRRNMLAPFNALPTYHFMFIIKSFLFSKHY